MMARSVTQVVEPLPSKREALSLNPVLLKKKKKFSYTEKVSRGVFMERVRFKMRFFA
jgi:hypothetical protein